MIEIKIDTVEGKPEIGKMNIHSIHNIFLTELNEMASEIIKRICTDERLKYYDALEIYDDVKHALISGCRKGISEYLHKSSDNSNND